MIITDGCVDGRLHNEYVHGKQIDTTKTQQAVSQHLSMGLELNWTVTHAKLTEISSLQFILKI